MNSGSAYIGHSPWTLAPLKVPADLRKVTVQLAQILVLDEGLPNSLEKFWFCVAHLFPIALLLQLFEKELLRHVERLLVLHKLHVDL